MSAIAISIDDFTPEVEWEAINAASWRLIDQIEGCLLYESTDFDGELAIIFANDEAAGDEDWDRIYEATYTDANGEWVWNWPNGG